MLFLRRSLVGLFLLSLTLGLVAIAAGTVWRAVEDRMSRAPVERPARERVMAVETVAVASGRVTPVLSVYGRIDSRRRLELRAPTGGRIVALAPSFEDGARVAEGAVLMRLDPRAAEAARAVARTDLAEAEAEARDSRQALELAREDLDAARAQADLRAQTLARTRDLARRGVGAASAVEEAALAESAARQAVLARRIALANAESRIAQADTAVARARIALDGAERDLADTELRAAFAGTLAEVAIADGGLVSPNERVATLIDPDALEVAFRVSTAQYVRLLDDAGGLIPAPVRVTLDAGGAGGVEIAARGRLERVGADVGAGEAGRRIFARLDAAAGFRPGDFVSVRVEEPPLDDVARLPATAVDAAGTVLVVGDDDRLHSVAAPVLRRQGDSVLVAAAGLEGQRVVAARTPLLGPGIKVRDLTAERAARGDLAAAPDASAPDASPRDDAARIALTEDRRAALLAAVEANPAMPADAKARIRAQLAEATVSARLVSRIEARAGG